jgi:hypothetical protein
MSQTLSTTDLQQQLAINKALTQAGLPQNKINSLIELAKERLMCDTACQREKETTSLKKKFNNAKMNLRDAPEEVSVAEKNYYVYANGENAYEDMLDKRYVKDAQVLKKKSLDKHRTLLREINILIQDYDAETIYSKRMNELLNVRQTENKRLRNEIDQNIATVQTNDRRTDYEDMEIESALGTQKFLRYIYFSLLVLWIIMGDFFSKHRYASLKTWILIVLYCVFPFIVNKLVEVAYYITGKADYIINNKAPKDVYL